MTLLLAPRYKGSLPAFQICARAANAAATNARLYARPCRLLFRRPAEKKGPIAEVGNGGLMLFRDHRDYLVEAPGQQKNSLFAGSDEGGENWACLASLTETCKLNGANPQTYFTDLLTRLVNGWPQKRIDELMPWHWAPERPP